LTSVLVLRDYPKTKSPLYFLIGTEMALASLILMVRAAWVIIIPDFQFMTAFTFESSFFISTMVLQVVITVSFIMMNSERFERNLLLVESSLRVNVQLLEKAITERKRLEEERLEMERKLLHVQKLESLTVMAGGIAHDFNNQLAVVLGNLELGLMDQTIDPETRHSIESAIGAAKRSAELSRQMQVYTGNIVYFPVDIDLNELLNRDPALLKSTVSKYGALNFETSSTLPIIKGDAEQLQRMVINILVNASEAIADKDGYVTLRTGFMDCDSAYLRRSKTGRKACARGVRLSGGCGHWLRHGRCDSA